MTRYVILNRGSTRLFLVFLLAGFIIVELFVLASPNSDPLPGETLSLEAYVANVLASCANSTYRPSCYDEEVPKLMETISLEEAFEVTRLVQDQDRSYQYCHVLGHELSARETAKDPDKWIDVIARCPSGLCSNGCIHGSFTERFRTEVLSAAEIEALKPEFRNICEEKESWHPTGLEQASCYHALGHLTMYTTDADIDASTTLCNDIAVQDDGRRDYSQLCYDGAFMQIFQPLEPEDFALVEGKQPSKEELLPFCNRFSGAKRGSCLSEAWPLFAQEIKTPEGLVEFCSLQESNQQRRCYSAAMYVVTAQMFFDTETLFSFCQALPKERQGQCFGDVVGRMIETDYRNVELATTFCKQIEITEDKGQCYGTLITFSTYNFPTGSSAAFLLCDTMESPWREQCLTRLQNWS